MFCVGNITRQAQILIDTTYECMMAGISTVRPGSRLGDIGYAIQSWSESRGFSVVREYCGHGIGQILHGPPQILHYGRKHSGIMVQPGMCFTVEPMINVGSHEVQTLSDGWTVVTKDRRLSAQWEHTIYVGENGYEILTL